MEVFKPAPANLFASFVSWLFDGYWPTPDRHEDGPVCVPGARRRYTPQRLLAAGDVADVHLATAVDDCDAGAETPYLLKISREPEGRAHLDGERRTLTKLLGAAGDTTYRKYLPDLVDSSPAAEGFPDGVNVFRFEPGFHTLEQVHEQHPALDGRHLAWIFKRLLTVLGFTHRQGTVHGAVLPCHGLIHSGAHGLRLVGWGQSATAGRRLKGVPARYRDWYPPEVLHGRPVGPATDVFLAARCVVYLAGGDPVTNRMPEAVPPPLRRFLAACLLESARMRPDDAWALQDDFDGLLRDLYGPPEFHELTLT
jgi:serine/threonine protein kinase